MSQITSYTKDTKSNIEGSTPGSDGLMAFATDTGSLYISNDGDWKETPLHHAQNKPFAIPGGGGTLTQTPVMHFDASVNASILDSGGSVAADGDPVSEWIPQIGNANLYQTFGANQPTYVAASGPNNKPGIVCNGPNGLETNAKDGQVYGEGLTIMLVASYPGLSANETIDQFSTGAANTFGTAAYHPSTSYIMSQAGSHAVAGLSPEMRYNHNTTLNHYLYIPGSADNAWTDTINDGICTGDGDAQARGLTHTQYYNENWVDTTHIYSSKQGKGPTGTWGNATYVSSLGSIHTYPSVVQADIVNGGINCAKSIGYLFTPMRPLRGLSLGKNPYSTNYYCLHTFHEVYVFNHELNDVDMRKLGESLATKWQTGKGVNEGQFEL